MNGRARPVEHGHADEQPKGLRVPGEPVKREERQDVQQALRDDQERVAAAVILSEVLVEARGPDEGHVLYAMHVLALGVLILDD